MAEKNFSNSQIQVAGENSLIVSFGKDISATVSRRVRRAETALRIGLEDILIDLIPSYASLLIIYDANRMDHAQALGKVRSCVREPEELNNAAKDKGQLINLPVWYGSNAGPDLQALASAKNLSTEEIIQIHQEREYCVYAIGFAPGFAYLGEVDKRIAAPRLATPRLKVPRGAVGIADQQTAVYPAESPGGWNLIGRCPMRLFDPMAQPPMPMKVSDRVRFEAIDRNTFLNLGGEL
ncbi:MAG: 5-oxoprolinase subunit PxpB [Verrucomicrobiota bacterium]|jgi:KipI family sensor histidine kinase inhibitor|nr:5-oxoprolinase subunit PxpB [Verrucomicrobiota bacterium]